MGGPFWGLVSILSAVLPAGFRLLLLGVREGVLAEGDCLSAADPEEAVGLVEAGSAAGALVGAMAQEACDETETAAWLLTGSLSSLTVDEGRGGPGLDSIAGCSE